MDRNARCVFILLVASASAVLLDTIDYYVGAEVTVAAFDCGSSGTKIAGLKARGIPPTMSSACATEPECETAYATLREGVGKVTNAAVEDKRKLCVAVATAGNRIILADDDKNAWINFRKFMTHTQGGRQGGCDKFLSAEELGMFTYDPDSLTAAGTQEAMYELATYHMSFLSAGGASAQFGFHLCSGPIKNKWKQILDAANNEQGVWTKQCWAGSPGTTQGTNGQFSEKTINHFLNTVSDEVFKFPNGDQLKTLKTDSNQASFSWAIGSFLGCPNSNAAFSGMNQALHAFREWLRQKNFGRPNNKDQTDNIWCCEEEDAAKGIKKRTNYFHDDVERTKIAEWLEGDDLLKALIPFTREWKKECRHGRSVGTLSPVGRHALDQVIKENKETNVNLETYYLDLRNEVLKTPLTARTASTAVPGETTGEQYKYTSEITEIKKRERFLLATQAGGGMMRLEQETEKQYLEKMRIGPLDEPEVGTLTEDAPEDKIAINKMFGGSFGGYMIEAVLEKLELTDETKLEEVPYYDSLQFIDSLKLYVEYNGKYAAPAIFD